MKCPSVKFDINQYAKMRNHDIIKTLPMKNGGIANVLANKNVDKVEIIGIKDGNLTGWKGCGGPVQYCAKFIADEVSKLCK